MATGQVAGLGWAAGDGRKLYSNHVKRSMCLGCVPGVENVP